MLKDNSSYATESTRAVQGIMFRTPSRQRFIPYAWLLFSEINEKGSEIQFHYTHCVVTVTGINLHEVHEAVMRHELGALREMTPDSLGLADSPAIERIEIVEKAEEDAA